MSEDINPELIERATKAAHKALAARWMTVASALAEDEDYPQILPDGSAFGSNLSDRASASVQQTDTSQQNDYSHQPTRR